MFLLTLLQVRSIVECLPRLRQNMMFSATIPPRIEKMASEMMTNPLFISVGVVSIIISVWLLGTQGECYKAKMGHGWPLLTKTTGVVTANLYCKLEPLLQLDKIWILIQKVEPSSVKPGEFVSTSCSHFLLAMSYTLCLHSHTLATLFSLPAECSVWVSEAHCCLGWGEC